ncbi:Rz-like spanin [Pectobacterium phage PP81]|uniref:Rz lysis protein n=1 Tax=Pectobacterium phage PP81 TaxID=1927014 RepID=A0A1L7DS15_9CAUD|nr:Rz-like spanin [Pectobacterium phage PP81]APU03067.1 Rz lysis protein [Pectobacterium phage PP81]
MAATLREIYRNRRVIMREKIIALIVVAVLGLTGYFSYTSGYDKADRKWKDTIQEQYITKQKANKITQEALNEVSKGYQEDIAASKADADRIISGLRSDNKRLSVKIKSTTGTQSSDGRCIFDGRAELHESTASNLIGVTLRADAHVKALQDTVRALQGQPKEAADGRQR